MIDCDKYKSKAIIGFLLFTITYCVGKYLMVGGLIHSGMIKFLYVMGFLGITIVFLVLALPYAKCLNDLKKMLK